MSTEAPLYWGLNARSYCTLIHVSQLSSFVIPSLGIILPIVLWIAHKDQNEDINQHGRVTANWVLSLLVYLLYSHLHYHRGTWVYRTWLAERYLCHCSSGKSKQRGTLGLSFEFSVY